MKALGSASAVKSIAPAVIVPVDSPAVLEVKEGVMILPDVLFNPVKLAVADPVESRYI